ncbi:hypothetical protein MtrunA17_Chr4g0074841 [Medicago truncatula]|uniref:Uncharacterized protein n=1 Tax=Medicago truncatula TaxID=3880 RepID=G7JJ69_MEDTR|nr:hypothetical protein MTR_4g132090 [Medicago truncatula]RHN64968.1 hypothetical protein MtrunA17_Chr4g0074841 [Medicago truncatula]
MSPSYKTVFQFIETTLKGNLFSSGRTDEDAEGEDLFIQHPIACNNGIHELQSSTNKTLPAKSRGRKNAPQQPTPMSSASTTQFGLTGYSSAPTYTMTPSFYSIQSKISQNTYSHMPNPTHTLYSTNVSGNHSSYQMLPPQPAAASTFLPVMYWPPPPPTAYFPRYYPSAFGYQSFPSTESYMSFQTRPYYYN